MNRRTFLKSCAAAASAALPIAIADADVTAANQTMTAGFGKKRPNVIYILADDLGYGDPGCYGQLKVKTPTMDKIAAEGMKFTDHYTGSTVCAPSRCVLMTGLHTGHCIIRGNANVPLRLGDLTVAEVFKQHNYATACIGKWGLGEPGTTGHPNNKGFDYFYGYLNQKHAHRYYTTYLYRNSTQITLDGQAYSHDLIADEALQFIEQNKNRPFFLYFAPTLPHADIAVPYDTQFKEYHDLGWPETPYQGTETGYRSQPYPHAAFAAMVSRLDRDMGRILALLKRLGLDEDTIVMFSSDNGPHQEGGGDPTFFDGNGPLRGIKRDLYEGGVRAPMLVRWPGKVKPGTVTSHISGFQDFLPTCCDLLNVTLPANTDGISFLPVLLGKTQQTHEYMYWEFYEQNGKQGLRKGKWKGVRLNVITTANPPVQLYDLEKDIGETTDVASTYPLIAQELKDLMAQAHTLSKAPNWRFYGE